MTTRHFQNTRRFTLNFDEILTSPIPRVTELTPHEEIERLEAAIADEQETIRAFASHRVVVAQAQERIKRLESEREQWLAAIYAADQEAFERVQRVAQMQENLLPETRDDMARLVRALRGKS